MLPTLLCPREILLNELSLIDYDCLDLREEKDRLDFYSEVFFPETHKELKSKEVLSSIPGTHLRSKSERGVSSLTISFVCQKHQEQKLLHHCLHHTRDWSVCRTVLK